MTADVRGWLGEQVRIEATDDVSFEEYLPRYFAA